MPGLPLMDSDVYPGFKVLCCFHSGSCGDFSIIEVQSSGPATGLAAEHSRKETVMSRAAVRLCGRDAEWVGLVLTTVPHVLRAAEPPSACGVNGRSSKPLRPHHS